jgi:putative component of membrane protein insertase Oxa1/YidC/SpoIIIJ protein YidD
MKCLILFSVELYWRLTDPRRRRPCLFRETCSQRVYRITREAGAFKGLIAFAQRFRRCRLGYVVEFDGQAEPFLRLSDRSVAQTVELSESMVAFVEQSRLAVSGAGLKKSVGSRQAVP